MKEGAIHLKSAQS